MFNATLRNMGVPTGNAQDGLDATGVTPPSGGDGIRGWLSGIYNKLSGTLTVALSSSSPLDVSDRSARLLGHVTVDNTISVGSDVTDRAGRLLGHVTVDSAPTTAVTGTFWQATQPVSGSVSVSNFPATQPVSLATNTPDVTDRAGRLLGHVTVDTAPTTAITAAALPLPAGAALDATLTGGTQKTKIVDSGGTNVAAVSAAGAVKVDGSAVTQPVSGTFFQATQPVSLATNTPDVTDRAARLLGHVTVDAAPTTTVTGTVAATQSGVWTVTQQALTKGTQGANGVTTQDLKDAGRTAIVLSVTSVVSIVTETVFTLNIWKAGTVTTGTSYTVTAGKTLRLQVVQFGARFATPSTTVTFANSRFNLRSGSLVGSPLVYGDSKMAASNTPTPNSDTPIPDGLEFPAGTVLSLWHTDSAVTLLLDALLVGYEY